MKNEDKIVIPAAVLSYLMFIYVYPRIATVLTFIAVILIKADQMWKENL